MCRDRAKLPTLLLLSSPTPAHVAHMLPELNGIPHATISSIGEEKYPSLGWQTVALKSCLKQIVMSKNWLHMRLDASRYAQLPVATFGDDWIIDTCDALFSRKLGDAGILSWAKDETQPDLSCHPLDVAQELMTAEQKERVQLSWPGMYRNVCIQIRINHLAVNAVLEAATLSELEGAMPLEEQGGCGPAFRVLKQMAHTWIEDASRRHNVCADTLLRHMYRWLCSQNSRLYDPRLTSAVQELMKKLLLNLVAELKKLGATVVHANSSCIILSTGKHTIRDALGYTDYILETLRHRELFQWMSLSPEKAWNTLLFYDNFNYLGLKAPLPESMAEVMSQAPGSLASGSQLLESSEMDLTREAVQRPIFDYTLTLADYLPKALTDAFISAIAEFVWLPWKEAMIKVLSEQEALSQALGDTATPPDAHHNVSETQNQWMAENIPLKFTEKLLKATKHIAMHIGSNDGHEDHQFPTRAGSYLSARDLGTPALAFIKSVCHLYALDKNQSEAVLTLRRQLLKMVHVKEFSPEARWKDPCATLIIQDVICPSCQDCQDLDLCRDASMQHEHPSCQVCGAERDRDALEMKLLTILDTLVDGFVVQDVKCKKCGSTGSQHLKRQCDICGGHMDATRPASTIMDILHVIQRVAEMQGMDTLYEMAARAADVAVVDP